MIKEQVQRQEDRDRPSAIRDELVRLVEENGGELLAPEDVVEAARPVSSPLHNSFTWDDTEAAQKFRLHEARQLIRAVVMIEPREGQTTVVRPVFVSLISDRGHGGYRLLSSVLTNSERRQQLLEEAYRELQTFRTKYKLLSELAAVIEAMERAAQARRVEESDEQPPAAPPPG